MLWRRERGREEEGGGGRRREEEGGGGEGRRKDGEGGKWEGGMGETNSMFKLNGNTLHCSVLAPCEAVRVTWTPCEGWAASLAQSGDSPGSKEVIGVGGIERMREKRGEMRDVGEGEGNEEVEREDERIRGRERGGRRRKEDEREH